MNKPKNKKIGIFELLENVDFVILFQLFKKELPSNLLIKAQKTLNFLTFYFTTRDVFIL